LWRLANITRGIWEQAPLMAALADASNVLYHGWRPKRDWDFGDMQHIVTLTERKAAEAARRAEAVETLLPALATYARAHEGRFLLFGSAARRLMKFHSDVDLLLDFPDDKLTDAWNFAETACWDRGLEPDLLPYRWCKPAFLDHIRPDIIVVS
jgi:predicted nucleotidyltransferase